MMFEAVVQIIAFGGVFGIAVLMFAENIFPPIPSELIMPLAGFAAARGEMDFTLAVAAGAFGAVLGAQAWYELGRRIGQDRLCLWAERHGRWLTLTPGEIRRGSDFLRRFGAPAMFLGRLAPIVRTWISIPAGVAGMGRAAFLGWTILGTTVFTFALTLAGYLLESRYDRVSDWMDLITLVLLVGGVASYIYRVATFRRKVVEDQH